MNTLSVKLDLYYTLQAELVKLIEWGSPPIAAQSVASLFHLSIARQRLENGVTLDEIRARVDEGIDDLQVREYALYIINN